MVGSCKAAHPNIEIATTTITMYNTPRTIPMIPVMYPALAFPIPVYISGFSAYTFLAFLPRTTAMIPKINPSNPELGLRLILALRLLCGTPGHTIYVEKNT